MLKISEDHEYELREEFRIGAAELGFHEFDENAFYDFVCEKLGVDEWGVEE